MTNQLQQPQHKHTLKRLAFYTACIFVASSNGALSQSTANKSSTTDNKKKGSLSECFTGEDATLIEDISNEDFPVSWKMLVDAGDTCTHLIFGASYLTWAKDQNISVRIQTYRHPAGDEVKCQPDKVMGYEKGSLLTTDQTPWPFENPEVCAILVAITNDDPENDQEVYVYTAGAATLLASFSASIVALSLLQF